MSPRRVLLTTDVVGGVWDFTLSLARALRTQVDVTLLALGEPSSAQRQAADATGVALRSKALKLEWMADSADDVTHTRALVRDIAKEVDAELVHANHFAAACADLEVPVVLTLHSDVLSWRRWTLGAQDVPPEWHPYVALVSEALTRADSVVAVSAFLARQVCELYGPTREISVIHNGWSPPKTAPSKQGFTLMAGRIWDEAKNVRFAAEAIEGDVYLAGEQRHPETGGVAAIPPTLHALGQLSPAQLSDWLARAAIYLSPARYDPFGLLPLQAALHGCALLLSDIPSYRELWHGAASFFDADDINDLRTNWRVLLQDGALRADLADAARARALSRYTAEGMARQYLELYATTRTRVPA